MKQPRILVLGAFDTKGEEYAYAVGRLESLGAKVLAIDFGVSPSAPEFPVVASSEEVAAAGGGDLSALRAAHDRGAAMATMAKGAAAIASARHASGAIDAVFGMGGSGGTSVITAAMRALPLGVPKVCLSTVAGGDTAPYAGVKDVVLYPSIADIAGLNRITRRAIDGATAAVLGMASHPATEHAEDRPVIAASMFGNTTACVDRCRTAFERAGFEVLVFHATGAGGRAMESLIREGLVDASLDLTTTELADTLCHGVFDAGPERLTAAAASGVPQLVAPGCVDMVNYGPLDTAPRQYRESGRLFYEWNPSVTLMRTTAEENAEIGRMIAQRLNGSQGPAAVVVPLRGFSLLGGVGERFHDPEADEALVSSLRGSLDQRVPLHEVDANINDPAFADTAYNLLCELINSKPARSPS